MTKDDEPELVPELKQGHYSDGHPLDEVHYLECKIILKGGSVFDCLVRNLSEAGALIEIASSLGVPDRFDLVIGQAPHEQTCQARVVRREATRLGVAFD